MRANFSYIAATILLLVVWCATPLLAVAHIAIVEHTYCATHDRLEEGGGAHNSARAELAQSEAQASSAGDDSSESEHKLCALGDCFTLEKLSPNTNVFSSVTTLAAGINTQRFVDINTDERIPLLAIAPKCSPPALV